MGLLSLLSSLNKVQGSNYGTEKETGWTWLSGMVVMVAHFLMWSRSRPWLLAIQIRLAAQAQVCLYAEELSLGVFPGHGA